jgi:hypothetical protein
MKWALDIITESGEVITNPAHHHMIDIEHNQLLNQACAYGSLNVLRWMLEELSKRYLRLQEAWNYRTIRNITYHPHIIDYFIDRGYSLSSIVSQAIDTCSNSIIGRVIQYLHQRGAEIGSGAIQLSAARHGKTNYFEYLVKNDIPLRASLIVRYFMGRFKHSYISKVEDKGVLSLEKRKMLV